MAVKTRRFGSFELSVADCKTWTDAMDLYGQKLVGCLFSGREAEKLVFISPASAKIGVAKSEEVDSWLETFNTATTNLEVSFNAFV